MEKEVANFSISFTSFLNSDGTLESDCPEELKEKDLLTALYRKMVLARAFDATCIKLQKSGELCFYASSLGEEAANVGLALAAQPDDRFLMTYRQASAHISRGSEADAIDMMTRTLLYWDGDERGSDFQGTSRKDFPICVPIATQTTQAVGVAMALKMHKETHAVLCTLGDGATSEGDFYVAMNASGIWELPVIFIILNNQWAISVPRDMQSRTRTLAEKGIAGGIKNCIQVDGNDAMAVYHAVSNALERARTGGGASVIEALTYRLSNHTTIDDAKKYRKDKEVEEALKKEPLTRLRTYLQKSGIWDEEDEILLKTKCEEMINEAVALYKAVTPDSPESMFDYLHETLPHALQAQRDIVSASSKEGVG